MMQTPLRRRMLLKRAVVVLSLALAGASVAGWWMGGRDARDLRMRAWTLRATPQHSYFLRLGRQHLILSDQHINPILVPPGYGVDSTHFREILVHAPPGADSYGTEMAPDHVLLHPRGSWFHLHRTYLGGVRLQDEKGNPFLKMEGDYGALEIPWWSLLVLFSALPGWSLWVWRRTRVRRTRGLCLRCGYDLRASPQRCPECGDIVPTTLFRYYLGLILSSFHRPEDGPALLGRVRM